MITHNVNKSIFFCWALGVVFFFISNAVLAESKTSIKYALLFGVQKFECTTSLEGPGNDLNLVRKEWLDKNGFQANNIVALCDAPNVPSNDVPTKKNFFDRLTEIAGKMKTGDALYIVVATHGVSYKGLSFLLPKDAKTDNFDALNGEDDAREIDKYCEKNNLISVASLRARLKDIKGNIVVVLDACRVNKGSSRNDVGEFQRELTDFSQKDDGTLVLLTSCGLTELANEPEIVAGKHYGLFLYYLVEGLQGDADVVYGNYDGKVSPLEAFNYASAKTRRTANDINKKQSPKISYAGKSSQIKEIVLADYVVKDRNFPFFDRSDTKLVLDLGDEILRNVKDASIFQTGIAKTIQGFDYVLKDDPNSRKARELRGVAYRMAGDYSKALTDFKAINEDMVLFVGKEEGICAYKKQLGKDSFVKVYNQGLVECFTGADVLVVAEVDVQGEWLRISRVNGINIDNFSYWVKKSDVLWTKERANINYNNNVSYNDNNGNSPASGGDIVRSGQILSPIN